MRVSRARHPDDEPLRASVRELELFQEHPVWLDVVDWIGERREYLLQTLRKAKSMEEVKTIQGALDQLEFFLDIPELFLEQKQLEQNEDKS